MTKADPSPARYDAIGEGYALRRRPEPRIAAAIEHALGDAATLVNVGAGAGSYEPSDREVRAVEPSETMIRQRKAGAALCVRATAEALPFPDSAFDAAMAILTIHHWSDWRRGLGEMRRVARRRIVLLTFDPEASDFWLWRDYVPALLDLDRRIMPSLADMAEALGPFEPRRSPFRTIASTASSAPTGAGPRFISTPPRAGRCRPSPGSTPRRDLPRLQAI